MFHAASCVTLQQTATHCNAHCNAHCNTHAHHSAVSLILRPRFHVLHCNTLQHAATRCNTLQHAANAATKGITKPFLPTPTLKSAPKWSYATSPSSLSKERFVRFELKFAKYLAKLKQLKFCTRKKCPYVLKKSWHL